jgi:hypothetical protein
MIPSFLFFINQLVILGNFKRSEFTGKLYRELVTALGLLDFGHVIMINGLIEFARAHPGYLVIDDTDNPKYGLKHICQKLFDPKTQAKRKGYKVVLFLWVVPDVGRFPIGFGLYDKTSGTCPDLALHGFSLLRNRFNLKPLGVLADGAYPREDLLKRLDDYNWTLVMRCSLDRKLSGENVYRLVGRGYGEAEGRLENGTKLKVVRSKKHFLFCNRLLLDTKTIRGLYKIRWRIEEVFRALKTLIGLDGCHQHTMKAQGTYIAACLSLFASLEWASKGATYYLWRQVNSGQLSPESLIPDWLFSSC